jgi:hypothetical protein
MPVYFAGIGKSIGEPCVLFYREGQDAVTGGGADTGLRKPAEGLLTARRSVRNGELQVVGRKEYRRTCNWVLFRNVRA